MMGNADLPAVAPASVSGAHTGVRYAGFWVRTGASLIDTLWLVALLWVVARVVLGTAVDAPDAPYTFARFLIDWVLPLVVILAFWIVRSATPGKMALKLKIVDATTLQPVPAGRLLLRYVGYYVAAIPLGLGLFWVGWDRRKQGWHDKMAGTVVVRG